MQSELLKKNSGVRIPEQSRKRSASGQNQDALYETRKGRELAHSVAMPLAQPLVEKALRNAYSGGFKPVTDLVGDLNPVIHPLFRSEFNSEFWRLTHVFFFVKIDACKFFSRAHLHLLLKLTGVKALCGD
ncbi:hypothetical protein [Nostoc sp. CHAB 5715]|uniref:hypothetical protein n=1 Tax=Nostoc sp. CHAB 5715 TaxID=2780400 RepID=UPI001E50A7F7|nr:hypothetical protein [Nostoc sp. CHAB 5715]